MHFTLNIEIITRNYTMGIKRLDLFKTEIKGKDKTKSEKSNKQKTSIFFFWTYYNLKPFSIPKRQGFYIK